MINEVMLAPSYNDGSIVGGGYTRQGEWIELYNPNKCDSVDISCFYLGNNAYDGGNYGGGFVLPQGTIVPPQGFCLVRGVYASAVPAEMLVENGGNVVEVVVDERYCMGGGTRLWFPNVGGWFAFYDANGVPQDAISWNSITSSCMSCHPCVPLVTDCGFIGELASYEEIPASRKNYITSLSPESYQYLGRSFRRIPDGGVWQSTPSTPTCGTCNAECIEPAENTCNAIAVVTVNGGIPPYSYLWNDPYMQTTDTAFNLCEGTYMVIVTDATGNVDTAEVEIYNFVPEVSHDDASFCYADSSGILQGYPLGGTYSGANIVDNVLFFEENVEEYQLTYTFVDSNGCQAASQFQVHVTDNTHVVDSVVCSNDLPFVWNGLTITEEGEYTVSLATSTGCDSVVTMRLNVIPVPELNHTQDTVIIAGSSATLWTLDADILYWTDGNGSILSSGNSLTVSPEVSSTYYVNGQNYAAAGDNLVVNGDFEAGNIGFSSDYTYVTLQSQYHNYGRYYIIQDGHSVWGPSNLHGHGGTGLFVLVDGDTTPNSVIWQQTVEVVPNTYYAFSAQIASTGYSNMYGSYAWLQFSINGTQLGPIFHSPSTLDLWQPYYEVWYSGNNTSATLTLLNQNNTADGNDFGLDDISFTPLTNCSVTDSIHVAVIGYPDNVDSADCTFLPEGTEWEIGQPLISSAGAITVSTPMVGDIDDDGQQEIICPAGNSPIVSRINIFNADATLKSYFNSVNFYIWNSVGLAKVKWQENEYKSIIVVIGSDKRLYAYDAQGTQLWQANVAFQANESRPLPAISFADFNHDGWTEIYIGGDIYDAATGVLLCRVSGNKGYSGRTWSTLNNVYHTVSADLCGDYALELAAGNTVYAVDIQSRTDFNANQMTVVKEVPSSAMKMEDNSSIPFTDGNTYLADMNLDGRLDVLVMNVDQSNRVVYLYVWDTETQSIICSKKIGNARKFGTPQIGDINQDGYDEICFITGTYSEHSTGNNDLIYALQYNPQNSNGELDVFWTTSHSDNSACTGLTLFDFNQDGISELVYRDRFNLRIINGSLIHHQTGMVLTQPYDMTVSSCGSATGIEYPLVVDVDLDGEAEIVVGGATQETDYGHLYIFNSSGIPWAPARKVWNQYMYNVTNVNEDLTIPQYLFNNATVFTDPEGVVRRPFNNFLQQATTIDQYGRPFYAVPDVVMEPSVSSQMTGDTLVLIFSYCNNGDNTLNEPYTITVFANAYGGDTVCTVMMNESLPVDSCIQGEIQLPISVLCGFPNLDSLVVAVNCAGAGIAQNGGLQPECDTTNNMVAVAYAMLPDTTFQSVQVCDSYTWIDGNTYTESTDAPTFVLTNSIGCDSVLILHLTVNPSFVFEDTIVLCESDFPYTYGDTVFENETVSLSTQAIHYYSHEGCDSVILLTINLIPASYQNLDTLVLENNLPLILNDSAYYESGSYTQTMPNASADGCDSVLTINMTVLYNDTVYVDTTICENDFPFTWNEIVFNTEGTQSALYTAANGVDSLVVMTVYYNPTTYGSLDTTVLQNDLPFVYYGESYSIPGIYTQTIENEAGCDSIVTINLEEIYNVVAFADSVVCAINTPFEWNGYIFTQTTTQMVILPASTGADSMLVMTVTVVYTTYGSLDTTVLENDLPFVWNGDSITTQGYYNQMLSNNAGCDSILTIHLHVLYNVTVPADSTVCESELPIIWNGESFDLPELQSVTQTIVHSALLTASTGVDSTVVMTVHVLPTTYNTIDTIVLENELPLVLNGSSYTIPNSYTQTLANANAMGCDSLLTVNMTVLYNVTEQMDSTLCQSELPLTWNGVTFSFENFSENTLIAIDSALLTASTGVDSMVVMTVQVLPTTYATIDTVVLENDLPLQLNGLTYMTDSTFSQTLVGMNGNGCDSILTVNLTVLYNVTTNVDSVICDGELPFVWNGMTFVADSIHPDNHSFTQAAVLTASTGVDSTVVMTVHVNYSSTGVDEKTACESYTWIDGNTYTSSTETATYTLTNEFGCDSVVTLHLTIYYNVTDQDTLVLVENQLPYYFAAADTTIVMGTPVESQFSYHLSTIHGCDSTIEQTVIVHYNTSATVDTMVCMASLPYTWHGHVFEEEGSFTDTLLNDNGSNHFVTWHLTVSNPTVTMQNITHVNCYGASTGSVGVLVSGGVAPYSPVHWENEAGTTVSSTAQLNNQPAGKYRLFVTDALGCHVTDSVILTHLNDSMVPGVIAANQGVCEGAHLQPFTGTAASGGAGSVYQWQLSTNGTIWNPAPVPNNSQNYTYAQTVNSPFSLRRAWISAACGTVYSNVITVSVLQNYTATIRDTVCQGYAYQENGFNISADETTGALPLERVLNLQTVHGCDSTVNLILSIRPTVFTEASLTICASELPYTYNDTTFLPGTPHLSTANFKLSTSAGCDSIHTLHLTVNPVYELNLEDVVCEGDPYDNYGFVVLSDQTVGVPELNLTQNLQSQLECDSIVNLHLTVVDTAISIVSLTSDFCEEYSAELSVETNMMNYLWSTGETSPTITVTQPGTYTVTAMQDHCSVSTWYQIETCELNIYLPNAITPDNDGINDYFCLHEKYLPLIDEFEIRIYTRWGELIYYSDDKNFKWNGEYRGRINRNIMYTYLINFTDNRGIPYQLTGTITVL